jgi:predicted amidohydrolase/ribosomal protein S18 acetylase RimI-like enzyme
VDGRTKQTEAIMTKLDLTDFEQRIRVRSMTMDDFDALVSMQQRCFPNMKPWRPDHIQSLLANFSDGQLVVEYDGQVVASSSSLVVDFDDYDEWHNWREISDNGYIRNHNPDGDTLYGIEIMVDPDFRGRKLARRLYDARKRLARRMNLKQIIIGGRIPGYGEHADAMSATEYVERVMAKELFDPVLTAQISNGFDLRRLIPDYFPSDVESRGYATFLVWTNLEYMDKVGRRFRAVSSVRLCVVQYQMRLINKFKQFAKQCEFFCDVASDYQSDFVLFPELMTTQLLPLVKAKRPGKQARQLADFTPKYLELFTSLAVKYNINIVGGSHFSVEEGKLLNVAYLFHRNGSIDRQPKIHVTPNEARWWGVAPGDELRVFETDRGRVAILICYDVEFPELGRLARKHGADIIFVPFNTDERFGYLRVRRCAQARAIENEVYVAISGCTGNQPFVENADVHYAQSAIFTPADFAFARDAVAAEAQPNTETLVIHDVDTELLRRHRVDGTVATWKDRRRDMYKVVVKEPGGELEI